MTCENLTKTNVYRDKDLLLGGSSKCYPNHMKHLLLMLLFSSLNGFSEHEVYEGKLLERDGRFYKPRSLEPYTGTNISWHANGQLEQKGIYIEGKKNGLFEVYYDNGQLKRKGNYRDGNADGLPEWYHKNGQVEQKGRYIEGKKHGLFEVYHENGQLEHKGNFVRGKASGLWEIYQDNGQLKAKQNYKDGKLDGFFEWHVEDGRTHKICYKNDNEVDLSFCKN